MSHCSGPFVIRADTKVGVSRQHRLNRASAMCLADAWAEAGYDNVRIIDPDGTERDRSQFRETLKLVKRMRRRALALGPVVT
jgi:hypothetical protein